MRPRTEPFAILTLGVLIAAASLASFNASPAAAKNEKPAPQTCLEAGCSDYCGPGYVILNGDCKHVTDFSRGNCKAGYVTALDTCVLDPAG